MIEKKNVFLKFVTASVRALKIMYKNNKFKI